MYQEEVIEKIFGNLFVACSPKDVSVKNCASSLVADAKDGFTRYKVKLNDNTCKDIIIKKKDTRIVKRGIVLLSNKNLSIMAKLLFNHSLLGYDKSCEREILIYKNLSPELRKYVINYYGNSRKHGNYYICLDYVEPSSEPTYQDILDGITDFHAFYYQKESAINDFKLNYHTDTEYRRGARMLLQMFDQLDNSGFSKKRIKTIRRYIKNLDFYIAKYNKHRTLTHNDLSYRNIAGRNNRVLFYDFELAAYQNPEHDLIEFLVYEMDRYDDGTVYKIIDLYRNLMRKKINYGFSDEEYREVLMINTYEFIANRFSTIRLASYRIKSIDIKRLTQNINRLLDLLENKTWKKS